MRALVIVAAALLVCVAVGRARADGLQLERYEPTAAGSWFLSVPHPWYSSTRFFAAGVTLDYSHNPLLGGTFGGGEHFNETVRIVEHQLVGHVDVAGSFLDRVLLEGTLPVVLMERGTPAFGVAPIGGAAVGDPRLGVTVRLWGQPDRPLSLHAGGQIWIPIGAEKNHAGESNARGLPQVIASGLIRRHLRYSGTVGVLIRSQQSLGFGPASTASSQMQFGAALAWADVERRWQAGPELNLATDLVGPRAGKSFGTALELGAGAQYHVAKLLMVGAGVSSGLVSQIGSPDVRVLVRLAYAPIRPPKRAPDSDGDGVADDLDACPKAAGVPSGDRRVSGCPDADRDGIPDAEDQCPGQAAGAQADAARHGCPLDSDHDGVPDAEDRCPNDPAGAHADKAQTGCPLPDTDHDGIPDAEDHCPNDPAGEHADKALAGCPLPDVDHDGIPDAEDQCPDAAPGETPDPKRKGCPVADADHDGIPDAEDACPKDPGKPNTADARSNGCPQLTTLQPGDVLRLHSVHFETNKWELLPESFPILDEVAKLLNDHKEINEVVVEGHADDRGTKEWNLRLSRHRAQSVMQYLIKKGVRAGRLNYTGFGDTKPLDEARTDEARAKNRRVEVRIPMK